MLILGLLVSINPLRLGVTLLVISRPRPMQNLLTYWAGCVTVCVFTLLVPLVVLHFTPAFASFTKDSVNPASNSTARHIQIGVGVFVLLVAGVMAVSFAMRPRAQLPPTDGKHRLVGAGSGRTSTVVLKSETPPPIARLLAKQDGAKEGGIAARRLFGRVRNAWENGTLWVAFVIGLAMGPSVDGVLIVLAMIVASGAAIGMQVVAAIAFVVGMLAVEEIILMSSLAAPAKTQTFLRRLHDWAFAHRRKILVTTFAVIGVSLVVQGIANG